MAIKCMCNIQKHYNYDKTNSRVAIYRNIDCSCSAGNKTRFANIPCSQRVDPFDCKTVNKLPAHALCRHWWWHPLDAETIQPDEWQLASQTITETNNNWGQVWSIGALAKILVAITIDAIRCQFSLYLHLLLSRAEITFFVLPFFACLQRIGAIEIKHRHKQTRSAQLQMAKRIKMGNISSQDRKLTVCLWIPTDNYLPRWKKRDSLANDVYVQKQFPSNRQCAPVLDSNGSNVKLRSLLRIRAYIFQFIWQPLCMRMIQPSGGNIVTKCRALYEPPVCT